MTEESSIHPTAVISPDAQIGDNVSIGAFAVIGPGVIIGDGCILGAHTVFKGPTVLGANNHIYSFASIGDDPQDKKFAGEDTRLEIGAGNTVREYVTINRGTVQDSGVTKIGNDNWLMAYSHIAHDCVLGNDIIMANGTTLGGHVTIDDHVMCSAFAGIHQFCSIGAHSFIGAYSGINQDIPPYVLVIGQPPVPRGINAEGLKRRGFSADQIRNLKAAYKILFRSGLPLTEARDQLAELSSEQSELNILIEFIDRSERGIIR